jgi:hypothetical protein
MSRVYFCLDHQLSYVTQMSAIQKGYIYNMQVFAYS